MRLMTSAMCLLIACATASVQAQTATAEDPFAAAAKRTTLQLYRPAAPPEGFVLGSVELIPEPSEMLVATYYSEEESQLHLMQTTPEGMDCPDCPTIEVGGSPSPYSREDSSDGTALVDLTVIKGKTAVVLGLRKKGLDTSKALLVLRDVAEKLIRVEASPGNADKKNRTALQDAAARASFAIYAPEQLPQFFYLKTVAYSPPGLAADGQMATPEQLAITYAASAKEINILVQPPDAFALQQAGEKTRVVVRGWEGLVWREGSQQTLALDAGDAMIVLTGNVQQSTLVSVARSLSRVR